MQCENVLPGFGSDCAGSRCGRKGPLRRRPGRLTEIRFVMPSGWVKRRPRRPNAGLLRADVRAPYGEMYPFKGLLPSALSVPGRCSKRG